MVLFGFSTGWLVFLLFGFFFLDCVVYLFLCFMAVLLFSFKSVKSVVIIEEIYEVRDRYVFILVAQNECCFYQREEFSILFEPDTL